MNFLFFKKNKPQEKAAEQTIDIAVPKQTRLSYKPRQTQPSSSTVNPYIPASLSSTPTTSTSPASADIAPSFSAESPNDARVTLESVLECIPSEMLKPDLGGASRSARVCIPANVIIPQLPSGKVSIPLRELVSRLPQEIFISQHPLPSDRVVNLPLHKVIPQLPADFFQHNGQQESLRIEDSFVPMPFGDDPGLKTVEETSEATAAVAIAEPPQAAPAETIAEIPQPAPVEMATITPVEIPEPQPIVTQPAPIKSIVARIAEEEVVATQPAMEAPKPIEPSAPVQTNESDFQSHPAEPVSAEPQGYNQDMLDRAMESAEDDDLFAASTEPEEITPIAVFEPPKPISVVAPEVTPIEVEEPATEEMPVAALALIPTQTETTPLETTLEAHVESDRPLSATELNQCLININSCTAEDLTRIPGVGPALAQKIVEFRNARGTITNVNQLRQIPGVGNKTFRRIVGEGSAPRGKVVHLANYLLGASQDKELTLQEIVRLTAQLPGVTGCIMATEDGMFVTGQLPASLDAQTISAFAPQLFRRVGRYVKELKVGQVNRFSLFTDEQPVSIFYAGKIYLVVIHAPNRFSKTLLNKCGRIAKEINRMCTNHVSV